MTDQDNLQDRMVRVLSRVDDEAAARDDGADVASTRELAQAIIDEFGLTVEASMFGGRIDEGAPYKAARVVGKWERQ